MINEDRRIRKQEIELLSVLKGSKLLKVEAAIAAPPNVAWNTVRIHSENYSIDVNCLLEEVKINEEGDFEEFGVISVDKVTSEKLDISSISPETEEIVVNKKIDKIEIFETSTVAKFQGIPFCEKRFTKAIVFSFRDECLVVDKLAWFDEMLRVSFGKNPEDLLYDESQDWEPDEDENRVSFEYSIEKVEL